MAFRRIRPFLRPTSRPGRAGSRAGPCLGLPSEQVDKKRRNKAWYPGPSRPRRGGRRPRRAALAERPCGAHAVPGPGAGDPGGTGGGRRPAHRQPHPSRERQGSRPGPGPARESAPGPSRPLPGEPCGPTCARLATGPGRDPGPDPAPGLRPRPPPERPACSGPRPLCRVPTPGPTSRGPAGNPAPAPRAGPPPPPSPGLRPRLRPSPPPPAGRGRRSPLLGVELQLLLPPLLPDKRHGGRAGRRRAGTHGSGAAAVREESGTRLGGGPREPAREVPAGRGVRLGGLASRAAAPLGAPPPDAAPQGPRRPGRAQRSMFAWGLPRRRDSGRRRGAR